MRSNKWFNRMLVILLVLSMVYSVGLVQPRLAFAATLFTDNFENGDAAGWSIVKGGATNFSVVSDNTMVYKIQYVGGDTTEKIAVAGNAGWTNYSVEAKVKLLSGSNAGNFARFVDADNFYLLKIDSSNENIQLSKRVNGTFVLISETVITINPNTAYMLKLSVNGARDNHIKEKPLHPRRPLTRNAKVMRGGSYLCHKSYCNWYRVAARTANTPDSSAGKIGFRCAADGPRTK
jgi:hypothetical protein